MEPRELLDYLHGALEDVPGVSRVQRFEDADPFSRLEGLLLEFIDGTQFNLPIIRTRHGLPSQDREPAGAPRR